MLQRLNLFRRGFVLSYAKISLLMLLLPIFSKALRGSGRAPLLRFLGISCGSLKFDPPGQIYGQSYEKDLIDLPHDYAQAMSYLLLEQSNSFRLLRKYYHYHKLYISPAAIKIRKYFQQILLSWICLDEFCFRSNVFQCQWCQCGQQK